MACTIGMPEPHTICNIYIDHNTVLDIQTITNLVNQLPQPYTILGDFNAKHTLWGNDHADRRGQTIEDFLLHNNVVLLNDKSMTHFHIQTNTFSSIDLTITSAQTSDNFTWHTMDSLYGSDHYPIIVSTIERIPTTRPPNFIFRKANWPLFNTLTETEINPADYHVDELLDMYTSLLLTAAHQSIPTSKGNRMAKRVPWWTNECTRVVVERKRTLRRYQRTGLVADKIAYKRAKAIARSTTYQAKKDSWRKYISGMTSETPIKKIWERIRKMKGKYKSHRTPCIQHNNTLITNPEAVANKFADHYSEISSVGNYSQHFQTIRQNELRQRLDFTTAEEHYYNTDFTETEFNYTLKNCSQSAPGDDGITYRLISRSHPTAHQLLLNIYNKIWNIQQYPAPLRHANILSFLKPDKPETDISSYRPIALTSCIGKLMEKMVNFRLMQYLETENVLSELQYGFRKLRSTTDALVRLTDDIHSAYNRKEQLMCIFFDLSKAYDTTCKIKILKELYNSGIRGHLAFYIKNFLSERTFRTIIGNVKSIEKTQEEGVPQGSVLSCTLFALAINNIASCLPPNIKYSLYVDDFMIYTTATRTAALNRRIQLSINRIAQWTADNGYQINNSKTFGMIFHKKRKNIEPGQLYLNNSPIKFPQAVKFLGLTFDRALTWKAHIDNLKKKCHRRIDLLKSLSHSSWGADRETMLYLYKTLIRPKLDYGSVVYASASDAILRKLDPIQNTAIRLSTRAFKSSPIPSLHAETGIVPLTYRREKICLQYKLHIERTPSSPTSINTVDQTAPQTFTARINNILHTYNLQPPAVLPAEKPRPPSWLLPAHTICPEHTNYPRKPTTPEHLLFSLFHEHIDRQHDNSTHIYTDGSVTNTGTGYAIIHGNSTVKHRMPQEATIFTAELTAIDKSLSVISTLPQQRFSIFTDSLSSLETIKQYNNNHPIVLRIQDKLLKLLDNNKHVSLCWVPSHVGIPGNEKADEKAKEAVNNDNTPIINRRLPHSDYQRTINTTINSAWKDQWTQINNNKLRQIKVDTQPWASSNQPRRKDVAMILTRLRIGHTHLTHHHLMERRPQPYCDDCILPLTIKHILAECPKTPNYVQQRINHFPATYRMNNSTDIMKLMLAEENQHFNINPLLSYLADIDILDKI